MSGMKHRRNRTHLVGGRRVVLVLLDQFEELLQLGDFLGLGTLSARCGGLPLLVDTERFKDKYEFRWEKL